MWGETWRAIEDAVVRPPRARYSDDELLGGRLRHFIVQGAQGVREDVDIVNARGETLKCSYFRPVHWPGQPARGEDAPPPPSVVYCHCNSGCRVDAAEAVSLLLPFGVAVMALDFSGSGRSDGDFVSLGVREVDDCEAAVAWLRERGATRVALWGRSMGAVVSLLYAHRDPTVAGIVCDSPFSQLSRLMVELASEQATRIPRTLLRSLVGFLRRSIRRRAGFDIAAADPLSVASSSFAPALFGHSREDGFIPFHHSEALHAAYGGDKNLIAFEGEHNAERPEFFNTSVCIFLHNVLGMDFGANDSDGADAHAAAALVSPSLTGVTLSPSPQREVAAGGGGLAGGAALAHLNAFPSPLTTTDFGQDYAHQAAMEEEAAALDMSGDDDVAGLGAAALIRSEDAALLQQALALSLTEPHGATT